MDSNHRCLGVGQESSPLDHGISLRPADKASAGRRAEVALTEWTHRELHPALFW
mgnify:CR=1 FL=1